MAQTAADVTDKTEILAAVLPNEEGVGTHKWAEYVTSIDDIERQTGYEFLSNVPEGVRKAVETRVPEAR